ncbi:MAG TPA: alanine--tRNA ligase-related protein [Candidatus Saccharimonadales bacterium]|jgi:Ser-tRNA(Ala) deacylase AlaX|nr:alanine--tRNA ligase-related protein [Candidatus Saccharimonadales bacterium]
MATQLIYLEDFDVTTCKATITSIEQTEDDRTDIQLDKTCFYPRGGGQDWDEGIIASNDGSAKFAVQEVRLDENSIVHHIGTYQSGNMKVGDAVDCAVDISRREINTRLHSAGHLVDMAVDRLGLSWVAGKGAHYPHMSFVEYDAEITPEEAERIQKDIEKVANEIIAKGSHNEIRFMPVSEMDTVCKHVPDNIPTNKPARVVLYDETFGIPCGGTHVKNVYDIGRITISKVKSKKGITKVSYAVEGIN